MSWANTFNSGVTASGLSSKMNNIQLNQNISPAEIQAKINSHQGITSQNEQAQIQNGQAQAQTTASTQSVQPQPQTYAQPQTQAVYNTPQPQYQQTYPQYQPVYSYPQAQYAQPVYQQPQYAQPVYQQTQYTQPQYQQTYQTQTPDFQQTAEYTATNPVSFSSSTMQQTTGQNLDIKSDSISSGTTEEKLSELNTYFATMKLNQGIFAKGIDSVKSLFSSNGTSKGVKEAIEKYENGDISYNEALKTIAKFEEAQNSNSEIVANAVSGAASLFAGIAASNKGGSSAKSIAIAAAAGAISKGLTKLTERSTNGIKGDALTAKNLVKDLTTGAINGAIVGGTANYTLSGGKTLNASTGSITGAISGGGIGYTNYMADVIAGDREFSLKDAAAQTIGYAAGGAAIGGAAGGISAAVSGKKAKTETSENLTQGAQQEKTPEVQPKEEAVKPETETQSASQSAQAASQAKAQDAPLSYSDIEKTMKTNDGGYYSPKEIVDDYTSALDKAIKLETNPEILSLYEKYQQAGTPDEKYNYLKTLQRKISKLYHPDMNSGNIEVFNFYKNLLGQGTSTGGKGLLNAFKELYNAGSAAA